MLTPTLAIVVPCLNEEIVLKDTAQRLGDVLQTLISTSQISGNSFIEFVDDGSRDGTWSLIKELGKHNHRIKGLKLTRNVGHQNALLAGLLSVSDKADCAISIDADLQQDEKRIPEFVDRFVDGFDIVYGIRENRKADTIVKKTTAGGFYWLMAKMGVPIIRDHADYRLVSKRVIHTLANYEEVNLFLRGLFPLLGYRSSVVTHEVRARVSGRTKYSFGQMLSLALNGITSFSLVPLRLIAILGFAIFMCSLSMSFYVILAFLSGRTVVGWASTVLPIYLIGGLQLLSLGIVGEYIGRIYMETKRRPKFAIEEEL